MFSFTFKVVFVHEYLLVAILVLVVVLVADLDREGAGSRLAQRAAGAPHVRNNNRQVVVLLLLTVKLLHGRHKTAPSTVVTIWQAQGSMYMYMLKVKQTTCNVSFPELKCTNNSWDCFVSWQSPPS